MQGMFIKLSIFYQIESQHVSFLMLSFSMSDTKTLLSICSTHMNGLDLQISSFVTSKILKGYAKQIISNVNMCYYVLSWTFIL